MFWSFRFYLCGIGAILLISLMLASKAAYPARPFVTDDARLALAQSCQLESWSRVYSSSTEFWALPACNPTGNLEFTLGAGRVHQSNYATNDYVLQVKTLFKEMAPGGVGWGLAVGKIAHPSINPGPNLLGNQYAYLPISFLSQSSRQAIHLNLGALQYDRTGQTRATWGLGLEQHSTDRLHFIAETFGDHRSQPYFQAGVRYFVIKDLLQIDATLGGQLDGPASGRWISFGLRYLPESVLGRR
jgi:hypothetical protein